MTILIPGAFVDLSAFSQVTAAERRLRTTRMEWREGKRGGGGIGSGEASVVATAASAKSGAHSPPSLLAGGVCVPYRLYHPKRGKKQFRRKSEWVRSIAQCRCLSKVHTRIEREVKEATLVSVCVET